MKKTIEAQEVPSVYTYKEGNMGKIVFKTLDKGMYAIESKNIQLVNKVDNSIISLGSCKPVSSKEIYEFNCLLPKTRLDNTFVGKVYQTFMNNKNLNKSQYIVRY